MFFVLFNLQIAHLASFFLTVNYALTAFIRLHEKAHSISSLQLSSVSVGILQNKIKTYTVNSPLTGTLISRQLYLQTPFQFLRVLAFERVDCMKISKKSKLFTVQIQKP